MQDDKIPIKEKPYNYPQDLSSPCTLRERPPNSEKLLLVKTSFATHTTLIPATNETMASGKRVWLITGASSGLGQEIARAALAHGDTVVATARDTKNLASLVSEGAIAEQLDVTSSDTILAATVARIVERTGTIDMLVNNAGYLLTGGVEEVSRDEAEAQFATNVFGQLNVIRAVLPVLRSQRLGVVANMGSIGGWVGMPAAGLYCASKACSSLLSDSLRAEVAHLGIKVTVIEPGYFRTDLLGSGRRVRAGRRIEDLNPGTTGTHDALAAYHGHQPGDPRKAAELIVEALTGTGRCVGRVLPPRLIIGSDAYRTATEVLDAQRQIMDEWRDLATATNYDDVAIKA